MRRARSIRVAAALIALVSLTLACGERRETRGMDRAPSSGQERERILGEFLASHWRLPISPQGTPPPDFSELEASLQPKDCGSCHPVQFEAWRQSFHAGAFSPGFAGQLIEGGLAEPAALRQCQTCHAPLAEQQPVRADGTREPRYDAQLRQQGLVCASCHVREHRRLGPPRRAELPPASEPIPHGGFGAYEEFQQSRFCAPCHQFFDDAGINGKPLENTYFEWQASPHAKRGETCQSCHMPDRAHDWRGIHHPETVRAAVDVELVLHAASGAQLEAALALHNRGVGHAFPSYVTPRVFLAVWQVDADGKEIEATRSELTIGREIDFAADPWREVFDTRVPPEGSIELEYRQVRADGAAALLGQVRVDPDHHYRGVYEQMLTRLKHAEARRLIAEALRRSQESGYVLREIRRPL